METIGLLFKVFWSPGEAMFRVSKKPRVLVPLLLLCLVSLVSSMATFSKVDMTQVMIRQAEARGQELNAEQRERFQQMSRSMTPFFVASATVGTAAIITIAAAIYFGIFTIIGREAGFKAFYAVTAFAYLPLILRSVFAAMQAWFLPQSALVLEELGSLSLAVFLDPASVSPLVYSLALVVDLISIWTAVLLIIGFKFLVKKSVGLPARVTGVVVVYAAFSMLGVLARMIRPS
jgi:hypothetical protein